LRDPARIHKIISLLESYWEKNPDLRLCQIILNAVNTANFSSSPYYVEDEVLESALRKFLGDLDASDN
jgi:uncharacterized protein YihD (DUF1040 family)